MRIRTTDDWVSIIHGDIRGHFLVDNAIHALLISKLFGITLPSELHDDNTEHESESLILDSSTADTENNVLIEATDLYDQLLAGDVSVNFVCENTILDRVQHALATHIKSLENLRTAVLWIQYCEMIQLLRKFIKAEMTGNWEHHLQSVRDMLPYFAAAGHSLYAKSGYVYITSMQNLEDTHPEVFHQFKACHHVFRRSDRYWAGLSTDLVIEQILMRSVKSSGGLTRGRGMGEAQRAEWLLSMPACADINNAMVDLSGVGFHTSDQHKEVCHARKERDKKDITSILSFLTDRNPFLDDPSLRNIDTGTTADRRVNADITKEIGTNIIQSMSGQNILNITFKRSQQVITLSTKTSIKIDGEPIQVDPQRLFQRITTTANTHFEDPSDIFKYELCCFPSSLFDSGGLLREAHNTVSNTDNKRSFLNLLSTKLCENGCTTINAKEDADVLIVQTALELANTCDVVLIGEDTDLLVLFVIMQIYIQTKYTSNQNQNKQWQEKLEYGTSQKQRLYWEKKFADYFQLYMQ